MNESAFPKNGIICKILEILPPKISRAIEDELRLYCPSYEDLLEIRLRALGRCSLVLRSGTAGFDLNLSRDEMGDILHSLTGGALYAYRDTLKDGYISPIEGLRVGVCGTAHYDGGNEVGVSDISSFVFRVSHRRCDFEEELYSIWRSRGGQGMLIYSPPCGGKTTAIRCLAGRIGKSGRRVCVIDERCEFFRDDYGDSEVDILRGYKKAKGIEIAVRTLGAELVVVDEIGTEEMREVLSALTLGIPFIATVHARSADEILHRPVFSPIVEAGVFETLVGIRRTGGAWRLSTSTLGGLRGRGRSLKDGALK